MPGIERHEHLVGELQEMLAALVACGNQVVKNFGEGIAQRAPEQRHLGQ